MEEIWRDIKGYKGLYQVSNTGRVKSLERTVWNNKGYYKTVPERILKGRKTRVGYLRVQLYKNNKAKNCYVHRLVAQAFLENIDNLPEVNHIDENKQNNCIENLEWCSHSYNNTYNDKAKKAGKKIAKKLRGRKLSEETIKKLSESRKRKPVYSIDKESGLTTYWESTMEASRQLRIDQCSVVRCCQGKRKSAKGFYFFYAESEEVCDE